MAGGPPSDYSQETVDAICERIAGGESLRSICKDDAMPSMATVCKWLNLHKEFAEQYARAREVQADTLFDEIQDIADDATNDYMERMEGDEKAASWQFNGEHVQRSKLRVEARKWMAGKLRPKKYGDKLELEHSGGVTLASAIKAARERVTKRGSNAQVKRLPKAGHLNALLGEKP